MVVYDPSQNFGLAPVGRTLFGREPAFWTAAVQALLVFVTAFGLNLSIEQTGSIVAAVNVVMAIVLAVTVRPINIAVFSGAAQAVLALTVSFGLGFTPQQIGAISGMVGIVLAIMAVRPQVVPTATLKSGLTETQPNLPPGV